MALSSLISSPRVSQRFAIEQRVTNRVFESFQFARAKHAAEPANSRLTKIIGAPPDHGTTGQESHTGLSDQPWHSGVT